MVPVNCEIAIFDLKGALAPQDKPLMLQPVLFCPVLTWAAQELMAAACSGILLSAGKTWREEAPEASRASTQNFLTMSRRRFLPPRRT